MICERLAGSLQKIDYDYQGRTSLIAGFVSRLMHKKRGGQYSERHERDKSKILISHGSYSDQEEKQPHIVQYFSPPDGQDSSQKLSAECYNYSSIGVQTSLLMHQID